MPRIFISFLGVNNYLTCNYFISGKEMVNGVKYVQEAILKTLCQNFSPQDRILIFNTEKAFKRNWLDNGHIDEDGNVIYSDEHDNANGLKTRISNLRLSALVENFIIPEGFTEKQIWDIFQIVYDQVHESDSLIIDITHAFRSIPMLGMVLINYLKVVKHSSIEGIYYGAFEAIGSYTEIKSKSLADRTAEILNLTPLNILQDWTNAANSFIRYGYSGEIISLTDDYLRYSDQYTNKRFNNILKDFVRLFQELSGYFATVRGKLIIDGNIFLDIKSRIAKLKKSSQLRPLIPLLEKIEEKTAEFSEMDIENGFRAVKWCIEHSLIQQGITLLQEMIITYISHFTNQEFRLNYCAKKDRELVSIALNFVNKNITREDWKIDEDHKETVAALINNNTLQSFAKPYSELSTLRNDINHGGFRGDRRPKDFYNILIKKFEEIQKLIT